MHDEDRLRRSAGDRDGSRVLGHVLDIVVLLAGGVAYAVNRQFTAPGFFNSYFDDVLAGAMLLAWSSLLASEGTQAHRVVTSVLGSLFIIAAASLVWECVAPLVLSRSTPDGFDVVAYFSGALTYLVLRKFCRSTSRIV